MVRATAVSASPFARPRGSWPRLLRLALTGLAVGAATGFVAALLRPRTWVEYAEPRVASRT
ncbi:MAG TPA: hypothetical protein VFL94_05745 [Actinomycetales bacterium]|nr:hypothetical protein [Actinomycetales bacterium]